MGKSIDFLLNLKAPDADTVVTAPAFSLTKVLASAAIVVGPLATYLVDRFSKVSFSSWQIVSLAVALLVFLAITAAADVLGRSIAAAAKVKADAVQAAAVTKAANAGVHHNGRAAHVPAGQPHRR